MLERYARGPDRDGTIMLPHDWLTRLGSRRVDRRQTGLLGAALLALFFENEPAEARRRRKGKGKSKKRSNRAQSEKQRRQGMSRFCGGIAGIPCPDGFTCVDDPDDDCDPKQGGADCGGVCVRDRKPPRACGGIAGLPCPNGFTCVDDPNDDCDPDQGGADCIGICVRTAPNPCATVRCRKGTHCCPECGRVCVPNSVSCKEACSDIFCGGFAGIECPDGYTCVDDPGDDCDPRKGGADCGGICVRSGDNVCATVRCRSGTHCCPDCGRRACIPDSVSCKEACTSTPCNEETCGPGEYCCNESCSRCVPYGQGCTREICPPGDPEIRRCGGNSRLPCPDGFICVVDPGNDCAKTRRTDCPGICVREPGTPCGRNRCGQNEFCCNSSCGECAPIGGGCTDRYCPPDPEPWPGGERCGKTICPRGQVCCNASCGICTPPNSACIMIACVDEIPE